MKIVVKIGGAALDNSELLPKCARAVADLARDGHQVAVVHGGGAALTRTLAQVGKKSEFLHGLRVTDPETRDYAVMVLAGQINKLLVAAMSRVGQPAIGLCGGDGMTFRARKKKMNGYDLGYVGEIVSVDPRWLEAIWAHGAVPVISSIAIGPEGFTVRDPCFTVDNTAWWPKAWATFIPKPWPRFRASHPTCEIARPRSKGSP